jgi:hypothetical protein
MLLMVLLIVGLSLLGIGCLYFGLRGASQMDFAGGVLLGATILLVVAVAYGYFTSRTLTWGPDDAASSVSRTPEP